MVLDREATCDTLDPILGGAPSSAPSGQPDEVHFLRSLFPSTLLAHLDEIREETPGDRTSQNMVAIRRHIFSPEIAEAISAAIPNVLRLKLLPTMRFIEYSIGGFIAPHTDGPAFDEGSGMQTTHTMLLYLRDTAEGGATEVLESLGGHEVVQSFQPERGAVLIFPHQTPHQGQACGEQKILLRGDFVRMAPV